MTFKIEIYDEADSEDEMADLLRHIADMVEDGYTSGYYPGWVMRDIPDSTDLDPGDPADAAELTRRAKR